MFHSVEKRHTNTLNQKNQYHTSKSSTIRNAAPDLALAPTKRPSGHGLESHVGGHQLTATATDKQSKTTTATNTTCHQKERERMEGWQATRVAMYQRGVMQPHHKHNMGDILAPYCSPYFGYRLYGKDCKHID